MTRRRRSVSALCSLRFTVYKTGKYSSPALQIVSVAMCAAISQPMRRPHSVREGGGQGMAVSAVALLLVLSWRFLRPMEEAGGGSRKDLPQPACANQAGSAD